MPNFPDFLATWQVLCARAWIDPDFKRQLKEDPTAVLTSFGFPPPGTMRFDIQENDESTMWLVLPAAPDVIANVAPAGDRTVSQYQASCI